jgi:hypothetical protein
MSFDAALLRVQQLQALVNPQLVAAPTPVTTPATTPTTSFTDALQSAGTTASLTGAAATTQPAPTSAGQAILNIVKGEVGVSEQPPGSNDSPRIAQYRSATAGAGVGPWCAYFTSWLAQQSGAPLGESGQGFGSVSALYGWAQRTGRAIPAGAGVVPQAGDLVVWGGEHVGIVESVGADGSVHTIEGNSSNAVTRRTYGPDAGGATGYVRV